LAGTYQAPLDAHEKYSCADIEKTTQFHALMPYRWASTDQKTPILLHLEADL
jgi:hypothetical protein